MTDWFTSDFAINVASNDKSVVILETLEFHHPLFTDSQTGDQTAIRCVNDVVEQNLRLEPNAPLDGNANVIFSPIPFKFTAPDTRAGQGAEAKIEVDNILGEISKYLDDATQMNTPISVIFRMYLSNDLNTVQLGPWRFECKSLTETGTLLEATISVSRPDRLKFAREIYDIERFPQLLAVS
jgi:hypothetical protein